MVVLDTWIVRLNPYQRVLCPLELEVLDSSNVVKLSAQSSEIFADTVPFIIMLAEVIQLNVPALFGLLLMRVANANVLVSSMQLR
jgi:hypothetical protein